jgi:hypothetical protein
MNLKNAILIVVIAEMLIAILATQHYGFTLEGLQATTRFSGRLSLAMFSVIFILLPSNRNILTKIFTEKVFLLFAVAHGIHLLELLSYVYFSNSVLIPIRLAGGFLAYIFIFALPVLQHYYENGKLSEKKYLTAENIYLYYVWFIFFMSYLPRVQGKLPNVGGSYWEFVVLLSWVCMLLGMKITSLIRKPNRNTF